MRIQTAAGEEVVYVFRDPDHPHRRMVTGHWMSEDKSEMVLQGSAHLHATQATELMKATYSARMKDSGESDLDGKVVTTLAEHLQKISCKEGASASKKKTEVGMQGEEAESAQQIDDSDEAECEEGDADSDGGTAPQLSAMDVAQAKGNALGFPMPKGPRDEKEAQRASGSKLTRMSSTRSLGGGGSSMGEDGTSCADETQPGHPHFDRLPEEQQLKTLVAKLVVEDILKGKKLGRQLRNATIQAGKMENQHATPLLAHIQSCRWAEVLSPCNVGTAKDTAVREAYEGLRDAVESWPAKLVQTCWAKAKRQMVSDVTASPDKANVASLLLHSRPWLLPGESVGKVDLMKPSVKDMQATATEKIGLFSDAIMDAVSQVLKQGEPSRPKMDLLLGEFMKCVSEALEDESLDDNYVRVCVELKRAFKAR